MMHNISIVIYRVLGEDINKISELVFRSLYEYVYMICMKEGNKYCLNQRHSIISIIIYLNRIIKIVLLFNKQVTL